MDNDDKPGIAGYILLGVTLLLIVYAVWATVQLQAVTDHLDDQLDRTEETRQELTDTREKWLKCEAEVRTFLQE